MRYLYIAMGMSVFLGCQSVAPPPPPLFEKEFEIRSLDLTKYATDNFLISQGPYGNDHVALAYISVNGRNGAKAYARKIKEIVVDYAWLQDHASIEQVVEAAVKAAKEIGADGLVGIRWHSNRDRIDPPVGAPWPTLFRDEIGFDGWAIKRDVR